ncbi:hypothetical protein [Deinococcus sp. JMULE3]|uniref:hypothetical protein n=1 Tax=Deinococcus sp. JMULE3 TaxID=2518341 RepID=UPI00157503ED|nr:hypothetical protein [Deinococcus sp. JMULE3]NTY00688.1 hypothetical protein [Deinococcus sp. JMULE3]
MLMFDAQSPLGNQAPELLGNLLDEFILDGVFSKDVILDWLPLRMIRAGRNIFLQEPCDHNFQWRNDITQTLGDYLGRRKIHSKVSQPIVSFSYRDSLSLRRDLNLDSVIVFHRDVKLGGSHHGWSVVSIEDWNDEVAYTKLTSADFHTTTVFEGLNSIDRRLAQVLSLPDFSAFAFRKGRNEIMMIGTGDQENCFIPLS